MAKFTIVFCLLFTMCSVPAYAQSASDLQRQITKLQDQVNALGWKGGEATGGVPDQRSVRGSVAAENHCPEGTYATDIWTRHDGPGGSVTAVSFGCRALK
jgi:hypothetical protein